ncbi:hypothetical protein HanXRQr2_Chr12g0539421 [Helianthus annuus]|uniref:Uncharacterized protein n=1 Tax=Helianthus annuus TaxID=4232 RepID=A0A9K3HGC4_HELAN|nr:hypothetical protein HanXRQr2_Chr12g0539421 [Helianthus annuus]KAJ0862522.1 hypothetical protein HanPSC8_Chr12g0519211 [Helianthus annuus]
MLKMKLMNKYLVVFVVLFVLLVNVILIADPVSRMARLDEGLKDITVRLMHLDPPQQFTNGTRRERKTDGGFRYALTRWKKC